MAEIVGKRSLKVQFVLTEAGSYKVKRRQIQYY